MFVEIGDQSGSYFGWWCRWLDLTERSKAKKRERKDVRFCPHFLIAGSENDSKDITKEDGG
jgi:hypothetical protein